MGNFFDTFDALQHIERGLHVGDDGIADENLAGRGADVVPFETAVEVDSEPVSKVVLTDRRCRRMPKGEVDHTLKIVCHVQLV